MSRLKKTLRSAARAFSFCKRTRSQTGSSSRVGSDLDISSVPRSSFTSQPEHHVLLQECHKSSHHLREGSDEIVQRSWVWAYPNLWPLLLTKKQRPTRGVGRSPSARITRNTVPRYTWEDGGPPAPAFTHYQEFDQPGLSEPRHRAWEDQTSYDPPTPKENWGQGNFSNYVPQEYEDSAYI
jgi:hypothetical protein